MTPEEQLEIDSLKQKLRQTEKMLEDSNGRIKAVELNSYEIKRNAKIASDQAEALKAEVESSLATASQQMQVAHAIGCGIFGMAELARAFMARKVAAARMVHREQTQCSVMQQFIDAVAKEDIFLMRVASEKAKQICASVKADGESNRIKAFETALSYGYTTFEKVFADLITQENS